MDDQRAIEIEKKKRGVAWTDSEGKRHEYERSTRTLYVQVQNLQAFLSLNRQAYEEPSAASLSPGMRGCGVIDDRSLSVIGIPSTSTRAISVSFSALEGANLERSKQGYKPVCLSYTEYDWEFDNEAGWWVQISLPISQFQLLAQAYESGKLTKLTIGLEMQDMFLDQTYYVPRDKLGWFIEPTTLGAKMVSGEVTVLMIGTTSVDLRAPAPLEADAAESDETHLFKPQLQDTISPSLNNLAKQIESIRRALHWIFWVLVVLLFVIGAGHH